jgi:hypothetical protein
LLLLLAANMACGAGVGKRAARSLELRKDSRLKH